MGLNSRMPPMGAGRPDNFQTLDPKKAVGPLLKYIPKDKKIWCCASGKGRMSTYIYDQGYDVTGTDILQGFDFMDSIAPQPEFDIIIENPPYSIKTAWIQRCYDLGKPFALLLPIAAMGEQKRVKMYKENGIQLLMPPERIEFITPNGTEGGGWFYTAWFCYGLDLPKEINFV